MFRILITDANYKHSIAIQRNLREAFPDIHLTGHQEAGLPLARFYPYLNCLIRNTSLELLLKTKSFDMVIPIGGESVLTVASTCPALALLASQESLDICFSKSRTMELAARLNIPYPDYAIVRSTQDVEECRIEFPCVLKSTFETVKFGVYYANNRDEFQKHALNLLKNSANAAKCGILVQKYISGTGCGFFALYRDGKPLRVFMHKRIREYPVTGGPSTAAKSFYAEDLKDYGLKILNALKWNGVAMVEFKHDERNNSFVLMEINAKFWGSTELALRAGVNFGADIVRAYRHENLVYSEDYNRNLCFYWPLDGDLLCLWRTRQFAKIRDYRKPNAATNLCQSWRADAWKMLKLVGKIMLGKS